jgi:hypothetical protein
MTIGMKARVLSLVSEYRNEYKEGINAFDKPTKENLDSISKEEELRFRLSLKYYPKLREILSPLNLQFDTMSLIGNLMFDEIPSKDLDAIKFFTMPTEFVMGSLDENGDLV